MKEKKQYIFLLVLVDMSALLAPLMYFFVLYFFNQAKLQETHVVVILCIWFALAIVGSLIWTIYIIRRLKNIKRKAI